jgi:hypothetical protein
VEIIMQIMTKEEYQEFRQKVLRFSNGADIHTVNTKLGAVINCIEIFEILKRKPDPKKEKQFRKLYKDAVNELVKIMRSNAMVIAKAS